MIKIEISANNDVGWEKVNDKIAPKTPRIFTEVLIKLNNIDEIKTGFVIFELMELRVIKYEKKKLLNV